MTPDHPGAPVPTTPDPNLGLGLDLPSLLEGQEKSLHGSHQAGLLQTAVAPGSWLLAPGPLLLAPDS